MVAIEHDNLVFSFPDVHERARCSIHFQRTLRIPDDGGEYFLPAGVGPFPLRHVDDFAARIPERTVRRGGVVTPMYQSEALWISFRSSSGGGSARYPFAVKIATGKVCAVSGEPWRERLSRDPQNYVVLPRQPWLDGYCVDKGTVRQFVAMPLGKGCTAEEQLTGTAEHGGLQIAVYPMKRVAYEMLKRWLQYRRQYERNRHLREGICPGLREEPGYFDWGLAPGGRLTQEVYKDVYYLDWWDLDRGSRCFVTLANAAQWMAITGERPPTEPFTAEQYAKARLPWFAYYDRDAEALEGAESLAGLKSVGEMAGDTKPGVANP